jgi:hypothetical protein
MNKRIISESKVRSIVRNELKNYLVQEGILDTLKTIGSGIKDTFNKARQQSVFRKSATSGKLLADLNYLQVVNAEAIANLVDQLSTTSKVDSTDPMKIIIMLRDLIIAKINKQDTDLKLDEITRRNTSRRAPAATATAAAAPAATAPAAPAATAAAPAAPAATAPAAPSPTDIETLTKLYRISASRETNSFNDLKSIEADDPDFLNLKGQYIEYAICKMIIQNLINPALGTDVLSEKQIKTIYSILKEIFDKFQAAKEASSPTAVETEDVDEETS